MARTDAGLALSIDALEGDVRRRAWCAMVAKLVAPARAETASAALVSLIPAMSGFPDAAWTEESAAFVSRQCDTVPNIKGLSKHLGAWWDKHKPRPSRATIALPAKRDGERSISELQDEWNDPDFVASRSANIQAEIDRLNAIISGEVNSLFGGDLTIDRAFARLKTENACKVMMMALIAKYAPAMKAYVPPQWVS